MARKLRPRWRCASRRAAKDERGQDIVEFALVVPFIALLFLGIIEFGIIVFRYNTVSNAAREGARYGIVHPTATGQSSCAAASAGMVVAACNLTTGLVASSTEVTATHPSGYVVVEVAYDHDYLTGPVIQALGGDSDITLRSIARMRTEQ